MPFPPDDEAGTALPQPPRTVIKAWDTCQRAFTVGKLSWAVLNPLNMSELRHHDVSIRGMNIHYVEAGEGEPLILIHGFIVSHKEWLPILPLLAKQYRCIALDLPGFGASSKPAPGQYPFTREAFAGTVADLMSALGLHRAHICGHSMGGSIALTFAADHPELVDKLVAIDSACYPFDLPFKAKLPTLPVIGPIIFKKLYGRSMFVDYFKNEVFNGRPTMNLEMVEAYYRDFDPPASRDSAYEAMLTSVDQSSLGPKIPKIKAKTLVVWSEEDRLFPLALGQRLSREIPNAELAVLKGCGHAPNEEKPDETAAKILAHLKS